MSGKRRFGRVRRLPSGRFQARYLGPDGKDRPAPDTFATKTEAEVWLTRKEIEIRDGEWIDPDLGKVAFEVYATGWIRDRMLKPRTEELYRGLLAKHLLPFFGNRPVGQIRDRENADRGPARQERDREQGPRSGELLQVGAAGGATITTRGPFGLGAFPP